MYDLSFFRANLDAIAARLAERGYTLNVEDFKGIDVRRRAALTEVETLSAQRNAESIEIGKRKKAGEDTEEVQARVRAIGDRITALREQSNQLDDEFRLHLASIPNLPHESVPAGKDETANVEIKRWGEPRKFDFDPDRKSVV